MNIDIHGNAMKMWQPRYKSRVYSIRCSAIDHHKDVSLRLAPKEYVFYVPIAIYFRHDMYIYTVDESFLEIGDYFWHLTVRGVP